MSSLRGIIGAAIVPGLLPVPGSVCGHLFRPAAARLPSCRSQLSSVKRKSPRHATVDRGTPPRTRGADRRPCRAAATRAHGLKGVDTFYAAIWDAGNEDEIVNPWTARIVIELRTAILRQESGGGGFLSWVEGLHGGFTIAHVAIACRWVGEDGECARAAQPPSRCTPILAVIAAAVASLWVTRRSARSRRARATIAAMIPSCSASEARTRAGSSLMR